MIIQIHPKFKTAYKKRIAYSPKIISKVEERIKLFKGKPQNPILKDYALTGKSKNLRAFSITGDIRVVYQPLDKDHVLFLDIWFA